MSRILPCLVLFATLAFVAVSFGEARKCSPVSCLMHCENGRVRDENGCELCRCKQIPPPRCSLVQCRKFCKNGFLKDEYGCQIGCQCRD